MASQLADQIRFVQFLHPGQEHRPVGNVKPWNQQKHRRTFVEQPGRCVNSAEDIHPAAALLHFWCEWECEATLVRKLPKRTRFPRYLFRPEVRLPPSFDGHANTDPCVFGDCFRYCICQQPSKTSLKSLGRGSLILFGSCLAAQFVVDTVFVVARRIPYDGATFRKLNLPERYVNVALRPIMAGSYCAVGDQFQLYEGATWDQPVEGMFSYFPCQPSNGGIGFPRPTIVLPPVVNPRHKQGIKSTPLTLNESKMLWTHVVKQVTGQGLKLGISAEMP